MCSFLRGGHRGETDVYFVIISKQLRNEYECFKIPTYTQKPFQGHHGSCNLTVGDPYCRSFQFRQLNIFHCITPLSISLFSVYHHLID